MELGKFEILEELGRGGFGIVYKAKDKALKRLVAIKVLHPNLVNDPTFVARFRQEAQIAAQLDHPNLVPVYDFAESEGRYFIVMGYMPGGSLKELIKKEGPLSKERALEILRQIGSGLAYAHSTGVIHRDLKPGNILFDAKGQARVSDMGFAKLLRSDSSASMSASGGLIGTPAYMAPEIWRGKGAASSADIYSVACILVEMLTGQPLFDGESTPEVMLKHFQPLTLPENLPEEWKPVIEKALEKEPENRFGSVDEFVHLLQTNEGKKVPSGLEDEEKNHGTSGSQEDAARETKTQTGPYKTGQFEHSVDELVKVTQDEVEESVHKVPAQEKLGPASSKTSVYTGLGLLLLLAFFFIALYLSFSSRPAATPEQTAEPQTIQVQDTATSQPDPSETITAYPTPTVVDPPAIMSTLTPSAPFEYIVQQGDYLYEIAGKFGADLDLLMSINDWDASSELYVGQSILVPPPGWRLPTTTPLPINTNTPTIAPSPTSAYGIGSTIIRQKDGMKMVYVPEGSFEMGSATGDRDEKPVRQVYLDAYWIDKYEVTNGQYKQCVAAGACTLPGASGSNTRSSYYDNTSYANYPVITVDWYQAQEYCQWAGGDLPTEAQWEKAARGTNGREFPWGNDVPNSSLANYNGTQGDTVEVGSYPQGVSPYGALDMAGNVWEWVRDWYGGYDANETNNPTGPSSGTYRVLHGGCWSYDARGIRAAYRLSYDPSYWRYYIGFRCVSPP